MMRCTQKAKALKKMVVVLLFTAMMLNGCASSGRPKDVDKEIYNKTVTYLEFITEHRKQHMVISEMKNQEIIDFIVENVNKHTTSEKEKEILKKLLDVSGSYAFYLVNYNDDSLKEHDIYVKELKAMLNLR